MKTTIIKKKFKLGKVKTGDYVGLTGLVEFELKLSQDEHHPKQTTQLSQITSYFTFSASGGYWSFTRKDYDTCGQVLDELVKDFPENPAILKIHSIWKTYHLNDMQAGTDAQQVILDEYFKGKRYDYDVACRILSEKNLYSDRGYKYGHAWLVKLIPDEIVQQIKEIDFPDMETSVG